jgi:hypothetical protein
LFSFLTDPVNALFIPVLYRDTNGTWITETPASGCLLIDRFRIVLLLNQRGRLREITDEKWFQTFEQQFADVANTMIPAAA